MDDIQFRTIFRPIKRYAKKDNLERIFNGENYPKDMDLHFEKALNGTYNMSVTGCMDKNFFKKFLILCNDCSLDAAYEFAVLTIVIENCSLLKFAKILSNTGIEKFNYEMQLDSKGKMVMSKMTFLRKYSIHNINVLLDTLVVDSK